MSTARTNPEKIARLKVRSPAARRKNAAALQSERMRARRRGASKARRADVAQSLRELEVMFGKKQTPALAHGGKGKS